MSGDNGCCTRCCNHCWFLMACFSFMLFSSLPRIAVIADFVGTLCMYFGDVRKTVDPTMSIWEFVKQDYNTYKFTTSVLEVVFVGFFRCMTLYWVYAYRFHLKECTFYLATSIMIVCSFYLVAKIAADNNIPGFALLTFSIFMTLGEYAIWTCVRRRRILVPQRLHLPPHARKKNDGVEGGVDHSFTGISISSADDVVDDERTRLTNNRSCGGGDNKAYEDDRPISIVVEDEYTVDPMTLAEDDSKFVRIDGIDVHYKFTKKEAGSDNGYTVVLMHGFVAGSVFSWQGCFDELLDSPEVTAVVSFDRPGFGLTSRILPTKGDYGFYTGKTRRGTEKRVKQQNPYTPEYSVYLLFRLLDFLDLNNVVLVGHSSGGALALRAAVERPTRVLGLCLISPTIYSQGFPEFVRSIFRTRLGKAVVQQLVRSEIGEVAIRRAWHNVKSIPDNVMNNYKNNLRVDNWHDALVEMASTADPCKVASRLHKLQTTVHIIHGEEDRLVPLEESQKVMKAFQALETEAKLVIVEQSGHVPHEETPDVVVEHILNLLESLRKHDISQSSLVLEENVSVVVSSGAGATPSRTSRHNSINSRFSGGIDYQVAVLEESDEKDDSEFDSPRDKNTEKQPLL